MRCKWADMVKYAIGLVMVAIAITLILLPGEEEMALVGGVALSHGSGFYAEPFYLEMQCDGGEIRYTLDSTIPDENSMLYTGPILIEDASRNDNVYSKIQDVCLELNEELLSAVGMSPRYGFKTPSKPVDKATVVRAVRIDPLGNRSEVVNGVYFVGFDQKKAYDGIGIVTITTDPYNLFDYEKGIYVLGKTFADTLVDGLPVQPVSTNLGNWPGNYKNIGMEWEREAQICFFDADRNLTLSGNYGIRIQGGASRFMLPKSLNIFARKRYGADSIPAQGLFGENWQLHSVNLNSGGQGSAVKIHDYMANRLSEGLDLITREYEPYALFLDGEFWGMYWLTPKYKEDYFENKFGIFNGDVIEVKGDYMEIGVIEDYKYYKSLMELIGDNDMSDPEKYSQVSNLVDMDNWIDYYALEIYIANTDWPKNNRMIWRTREISDHPFADGKWRWILFDVNISMQAHEAADDYVQRTESRDAIFASLMENEAFRTALYDRLVELAQHNFNPERVDGFIEDYKAMMGDAMENEYARFYNGERTKQDFINDCDAISRFFRDRYEYITEAYGEKQE